MDLFDSDINLGNILLHQPEKLLSEFKSTTIKLQENLITSGYIKVNISIRICNLPTVDGLHMENFPSNSDVGSFVQIPGFKFHSSVNN